MKAITFKELKAIVEVNPEKLGQLTCIVYKDDCFRCSNSGINNVIFTEKEKRFIVEWNDEHDEGAYLVFNDWESVIEKYCWDGKWSYTLGIE